jgi:hypothetical protein
MAASYMLCLPTGVPTFQGRGIIRDLQSSDTEIKITVTVEVFEDFEQEILQDMRSMTLPGVWTTSGDSKLRIGQIEARTTSGDSKILNCSDKDIETRYQARHFDTCFL